MNKLVFLSVLLAAVLSTVVDIVQSCGCFPLHPQSNFCHAQFVMKIRRLRLAREVPSMFGPPDIKYHVRVLQYFKPTRNTSAFPLRPMQTIYTSTSPEACGVTLQNGKEYVLTGFEFMGKLRINVCGWIQEWSQVTEGQKAGLGGDYKNGCKCEVRTCRDENDCDPDPGSCILPQNVWTKNGRCLMETATCKKSNGGCKWSKPECEPKTIKPIRLLKNAPAALMSKPRSLKKKRKRYRH